VDVKELVSGAPLTAVYSIDVSRLLAGKVVTVAGTPFKLEVGGGDAKGLANQFAQVKTSV